jgi:Major capsid protein N-terminus/Large eukaryotic DNA virus major capsid protein
MSGGIVQLVATGAQDTWLTGKPEVSFFRSNYKRYTHYAATNERQVIQGAPTAASISTVRIEKKGDLLSYVYLMARDSNAAPIVNLNWSNVIDKVELLIGGQVIDTQDIQYMTDVEPVTGAQTWNQRYLNFNPLALNAPQNTSSTFLPLKFSFCKDWSVALPLVALQYHDVELRITWSPNLSMATAGTEARAGGPKYNNLQYICWANFVYLDQVERDFFAKNTHDMLITQVQRVPIGTSAMQELALAHPVKFLAWQCESYGSKYNQGGVGSGSATAANYQLKVQINGVDVGESRHLPAYTDIAQYYHTQYGYVHNGALANVAVIPYCLDTSKLQPTGTLNFSRLDTYRLVVPAALTNGLDALTNQAIGTAYIYAVNYNVLRIQKGMGSVLYAS